MWLPMIVVVSLFAAGALLGWSQRRQARVVAARLASELSDLLDLIQGVQKHRGLSGQSAHAALRQREQIAAQLDTQWQGGADASHPDLRATLSGWRALRTTPSDFDAHCHLIDRLLVLLALRERQLCALVNIPLQIAERCREIEDLGRVRGLAVRASRHAHCPIDMEVPLRYLNQRLAGGQLQAADTAIGLALREIRAHLLDAPRVAISPDRCFDLLTPCIDRALDALRDSLPSLDGRARRVRSVRAAPALDLAAVVTPELLRR